MRRLGYVPWTMYAATAERNVTLETRMMQMTADLMRLRRASRETSRINAADMLGRALRRQAHEFTAELICMNCGFTREAAPTYCEGFPPQ